MTPKRILLIGDFARSSDGAIYYNTNFVLQTGFIRAGHHVLAFSDRDVARESSLLGRKALGRRSMNHKLIACAQAYQPHLVLFGHADMTDIETFAAIRACAPGCRLAQFNVDAVFRDATMAQFRTRAEHVDVSFITTAAPDRLRALTPRPHSIAYFPNPVDASIAVDDLSRRKRDNVAFDGIFLGTGIERRKHQVQALKDHLPADVRFFAGGGVCGTERLSGPAFLQTLATATMSPNLPLDDTVAVDFLYASDRIAQLLAHGIVPFCQEAAGLEALYDDGVVAYSTPVDLAAKMAELTHDDARRQRIAGIARRIGLERTGAERVARYMLDLALGDGATIDYGWPSELI